RSKKILPPSYRGIIEEKNRRWVRKGVPPEVEKLSARRKQRRPDRASRYKAEPRVVEPPANGGLCPAVAWATTEVFPAIDDVCRNHTPTPSKANIFSAVPRRFLKT